MMRIHEVQSVSIDVLGIMMPGAEPVDPLLVLEKELLQSCKKAGTAPSAVELSRLLEPHMTKLVSKGDISPERASEFCLLVIHEALDMAAPRRDPARHAFAS